MDEIRYYLKVYFPVDNYGVVETFLDENVNDSKLLSIIIMWYEEIK